MTRECSERSRSKRGARAIRVRAIASASVYLVCAVLAAPAHGHPLAPMLLELIEREAGHVDVRWKEPALGTRGLALAPELPDDCAVDRPAEHSVEDAGLVYRWRMLCSSGGLTGRRIGVEGLAGSRANVLLRVELLEGGSLQMLLTGRRPAWTVPEEASSTGVAVRYVALGATHLASGPDHLLFLVCLLLLVPGRRALFATITAFTVGHAVTLTLAALGRIAAGEIIVEVGIAASIVLLAAELAGRAAGGGAGEPGGLGRRPWAVAFAFGLLHGLGFAGALAHVGLPRADLALALAGFNFGIELAQLAFIAVLLGLAAALRAAAITARSGAARATSWRDEGHAASVVPYAWQRGVAYGVGTIAAYWCIERAGLLF